MSSRPFSIALIMTILLGVGVVGIYSWTKQAPEAMPTAQPPSVVSSTTVTTELW